MRNLRSGKPQSFLEYFKRSKTQRLEDPFPSIVKLKEMADKLTKFRPTCGKPSKSYDKMFVSRNFSNLSMEIEPLTKEVSSIDDVQMTISGTVGLIELDRPTKLNALTLKMIMAITNFINILRSRISCRAIVIKARDINPDSPIFCAGGDVIEVINTRQNYGINQAMDFFKHEYQLNYLISLNGPGITPVISIMDGITFGGGAGLSVHAPFCVSTDRSVFAMPETAIGFYPDVGASYFLSRLDSGLGYYLGLTGEKLRGQQLYHCRLATHYIPHHRIDELIIRLSGLDCSAPNFNMILNEFSGVYQPETIFPVDENSQNLSLPSRPFLDYVFKKSENYDDILQKLMKFRNNQNRSLSIQSSKILTRLQELCPDSLHKTVKVLKQGEQLISLPQCLTMELAVSRYFLSEKSFDFGVRSKLIEKKKTVTHWPEPFDADYSDSFISRHVELAGEIKENHQHFQTQSVWTLPSENDIRRCLSKYNGSRSLVRQHFIDRYSPYKLAISEHLDLVINYIEKVNKL